MGDLFNFFNMKAFRGHLLPDDLFYLVLSYNDKTNWQWFKDNNLTVPKDFGFSLVNKITIEQLNDLINHAIKYNLDHIKYEAENS